MLSILVSHQGQPQFESLTWGDIPAGGKIPDWESNRTEWGDNMPGWENKNIGTEGSLEYRTERSWERRMEHRKGRRMGCSLDHRSAAVPASSPPRSRIRGFPNHALSISETFLYLLKVSIWGHTLST